MKLYIYEHCPFCTRARMMFGLKSLPVELVVVMEGDAETPMRLIGRKAVPILQHEDGSCMGESLDIVRHVDAIGTPLLAGVDDPALHAWSKDAWGPALKLFVPRFTRADFAELATVEARAAFRAREEKAFGDLDALLADTPRLLADVNARLAALSPLLSGRAAPAMADIVLWPILRSLSIVRGLEFPPEVIAYLRHYEHAGGVPLLFDQAC